MPRPRPSLAASIAPSSGRRSRSRGSLRRRPAELAVTAVAAAAVDSIVRSVRRPIAAPSQPPSSVDVAGRRRSAAARAAARRRPSSRSCRRSPTRLRTAGAGRPRLPPAVSRRRPSPPTLPDAVLTPAEPFVLLEPVVEPSRSSRPRPHRAVRAARAGRRAVVEPSRVVEPIASRSPASDVDEFEAAARLFSFTGETPIQADAEPSTAPSEASRRRVAAPPTPRASAAERRRVPPRHAPHRSRSASWASSDCSRSA